MVSPRNRRLWIAARKRRGSQRGALWRSGAAPQVPDAPQPTHANTPRARGRPGIDDCGGAAPQDTVLLAPPTHSLELNEMRTTVNCVSMYRVKQQRTSTRQTKRSTSQGSWKPFGCMCEGKLLQSHTLVIQSYILLASLDRILSEVQPPAEAWLK